MDQEDWMWSLPAVHDLPLSEYPFTIKLYSAKTGEVVWEKTVDAPPEGVRHVLRIPGFYGTEHWPVRCEITGP